MSRPKKAVDMGFRCPGEIVAKIRAQAVREQRSLAGTIRFILAQYYQGRAQAEAEAEQGL